MKKVVDVLLGITAAICFIAFLSIRVWLEWWAPVPEASSRALVDWVMFWEYLPYEITSYVLILTTICICGFLGMRSNFD